jgi:hypothetical protein
LKGRAGRRIFRRNVIFDGLLESDPRRLRRPHIRKDVPLTSVEVYFPLPLREGMKGRGK